MVSIMEPHVPVADNYRLEPGQSYVIQFSGGRSSAYLLKQILDAHGGKLPANALVCFQNTGKEKRGNVGIHTDVCCQVGRRYYLA